MMNFLLLYFLVDTILHNATESIDRAIHTSGCPDFNNLDDMHLKKITFRTLNGRLYEVFDCQIIGRCHNCYIVQCKRISDMPIQEDEDGSLIAVDIRRIKQVVL